MIKESAVCAPLAAITHKESYHPGDCNVAINNQARFVSSQELNRQLKEAFQRQLTPILYLNEGAYRLLPTAFYEQVGDRLSTILTGITDNDRQKIVFAYSPQWLSQPASQDELWTLLRNHRLLRQILNEIVSPETTLAYAGPLTKQILTELTGDLNINGVVRIQDKEKPND